MPARPFRTAVGLSCAVAAGLGVASCGGGAASNGVAGKSAEAIVAASKQAVDTATSVHVAGSVAAAGAPTTFDLNLVKGQGGRGTLSVSGVSIDVIRIGSTIYINGSPAFYRRFGGAAAAQLFQGRWLKAQLTSASFAAIGPFTDLPGFVDKALTPQPNMTLTRGQGTTIGGQKVIQVKDSSQGTLSVAATGQPYPVQIAKGGTTGASISLDHWNDKVNLSAPANPVDINKLQTRK